MLLMEVRVEKMVRISMSLWRDTLSSSYSMHAVFALVLSASCKFSCRSEFFGAAT
jgi:hypothetical protein